MIQLGFAALFLTAALILRRRIERGRLEPAGRAVLALKGHVLGAGIACRSLAHLRYYTPVSLDDDQTGPNNRAFPRRPFLILPETRFIRPKNSPRGFSPEGDARASFRFWHEAEFGLMQVQAVDRS